MDCHLIPSTRDIREVFEQEIAGLGGSISDLFDDGQRLFLRSVLPARKSVGPNDDFKQGVALRAAGNQILVNPYTFRLVCANGAIQVQATETRRLERIAADSNSWEMSQLTEHLREAITCCAGDQAFIRAIGQMRSAMETQADFAIIVMSQLSRFPAAVAGSMIKDMMQRFAEGGDDSAYGLMNAVTATARDTRDPDLRWRLEELGGAIPARLPRRPKCDSPSRAVPARVEEAVLV